MKINEKTAKELFLKKYPTGEGMDFAGRMMIYEEYNLNTECGWNIDHILPESKGGKDNEGNLQCTNIVSNQIKADKTTWIDGNKMYEVRKVRFKKKTYKVVCIREISLLEKLPDDIINTDKEDAKRQFLNKFPNGIGYDYIGRKMRVNDYKNANSAYGWALGYTLSNTKGGKNDSKNISFFNYASLIAKGRKQSWEDGGLYWQVRKKNGAYIIVEVYHENGKTYLKE